MELEIKKYLQENKIVILCDNRQIFNKCLRQFSKLKEYLHRKSYRFEAFYNDSCIGFFKRNYISVGAKQYCDKQNYQIKDINFLINLIKIKKENNE